MAAVTLLLIRVNRLVLHNTDNLQQFPLTERVRDRPKQLRQFMVAYAGGVCKEPLLKVRQFRIGNAGF